MATISWSQGGTPKKKENGLTIGSNVNNDTFDPFNPVIKEITTDNPASIKTPSISVGTITSKPTTSNGNNNASNNTPSNNNTPSIDNIPSSDNTPSNDNTSSTTPSYSDSSESNTKSDAENFAANYGDFNYANKVIIDDVLKQYLNREKFSYDFNEDALYQQYKDKYIQQGKMAMQDTMGQAAALTGGYGNSYAATVGNQAYNASLENLNDIIPELYQLAYDRYNQEGQDILNKYSLLADDMATEYGMWSDKYNRLYTDYRNQIGDSQWQAQFDEGVRQYDEQFAYQKDRDAVSDKQWEDSFNYQKDRDTVSDSHWEQEFNYGKEQDATKNNQWQKEYDSSTYDNGGYSTDAIRKAQNYVGADADGMWGSQSAKAAKAMGYDSLEDLMKHLGISPDGGGNPDYDSIVADLNDYIEMGASRSEISSLLKSALASGYITQEEYNELKETFLPTGNGGHPTY